MMRLAPGVVAIALLSSCAAPRAVPPVMPFVPVPAVAVQTAPALTIEGEAVQGGLITGRVVPADAALTLAGRAVPVATDGRFILGFDRDAVRSQLLVATAGGMQLERLLSVLPRAWRIERVDAPYRAGRSDAEFDALRPAELAAIAAARAIRTDAAGWRQAFRWPASGRQSGWFGSQRVYQGKPGSYHSGADVAVPTGTPVVAPADGVVILAAEHPFTLEGNLLMLDHGMGLSSALLHLSRIDVRVGDHVRQGQAIALSGATGRATGPHLHWGLQWQGAKLDPVLVAGTISSATQ